MKSELGKNQFERHLVKRNARKGRAKKVLVASLMLTSMVDMFSLLVIFLLQSYSATGELFYMNKNVELPSAIFGKPVEQALHVAISEKEVTIDEIVIGKLDEVSKDPSQFVLRVKKFIHEDKKVNLQADKNLPSTKVSLVMGLLQQAGYQDFRITTNPGARTL